MTGAAAGRAAEAGFFRVRPVLSRAHRAVRATARIVEAAVSSTGQGIAQLAQLNAEHQEQELEETPEHHRGVYTVPQQADYSREPTELPRRAGGARCCGLLG
jgi:hypothetical protein